VPLWHWSPESGLTRCLAFASGGKLLSNLFDRHGIHLLSTPLSHNIISFNGLFKVARVIE
jgi:hypothetical protein